MTDKDIKNIYEYMGWDFEIYLLGDYAHPLDSNLAWDCVQEMEKRGDWLNFFKTSAKKFDWIDQFFLWLMNPTNFFNCMAKWLEGREK